MKIFAVGGSMRPFIRSGDFLSLEFRVDSLKRGDVVLYRKGDKYFIHRISKKVYGGYVVDDDAVIVGKHFVDVKEITGKVKLPFYLEGFLGFTISRILNVFFRVIRKIKILFSHLGKCENGKLVKL